MTNLSVPATVDYADQNIEVGVNEMLLALDQAWRQDTTLDLSGGSASPVAAVAQRTMLWRLSGVATSGRTVTLPAVTKPYLVYLPISATNTVDIIKGSTTITHPVGAMRWYYSGAGANDLWAMTIPGGGVQSVTPSNFVGAVVGIDSGAATITGNSTHTYSWRRKIFDTHGFHENATNPSRFTIPSGVTRVNFRVAVYLDSSLFGERWEHYVHKNATDVIGFHAFRTGTANPGMTFETGPIECTGGDYFEVKCLLARAGTFNINLSTAICEMEVLGGALFEGAYSGVPVDIKMDYIAGTPAVSTTIYKRMVTSDLVFPANFAGSVASVGTNPSGTTTLDIKDDGTTIGTLAFDTSGNPTFATTGGTSKTVAAGSRVEIVTQGSVNGIAGIAASLKGYANG